MDVCNNVLFTYYNDTLINGNQYSQFHNERGYSFVERVDGAKYFAYYPYNADYNGKSLEWICENFKPLDDQHTKESFDKSDLMAPESPILPAGDKLLFEMKHKMATISIFYNNEWDPAGHPLYPILLYSQTSPASLRLENTYRAPTGENTLELRHRYLVNPKKNQTVKLVGSLQEKSVRYFSSTLNVEPGVLYSISFEGAPLVQYSDGVDLALDNVEFVDRSGNTVILGHTVIWSKYNLGESKGESYPFYSFLPPIMTGVQRKEAETALQEVITTPGAQPLLNTTMALPATPAMGTTTILTTITRLHLLEAPLRRQNMTLPTPNGGAENGDSQQRMSSELCMQGAHLK